MDEHAPIDPSDPTSSAAPTEPLDAASAVGPDFDAAGDPLPARTFAPGIDDATLGFSAAVRQPAGCPWCGATLPQPDLPTCPTCGAALQPVAELPDIPGVTVAPADVRRVVGDVSPEILALVTPPITDAIAAPGGRPELGPPDPMVRRAMLELELEAVLPGLAAALAAPEGVTAAATEEGSEASAADSVAPEAGPER